MRNQVTNSPKMAVQYFQSSRNLDFFGDSDYFRLAVCG